MRRVLLQPGSRFNYALPQASLDDIGELIGESHQCRKRYDTTLMTRVGVAVIAALKRWVIVARRQNLVVPTTGNSQFAWHRRFRDESELGS